MRFMPPTAFAYPSNKVHDARDFGPVCMQLFPIELRASNQESASAKLEPSFDDSDKFARIVVAGNAKPSGDENNNNSSAPAMSLAQQRALRALLTPSLYRRVRGQLQVLGFERRQSEDCLNLNVYTTRAGKQIADELSSCDFRAQVNRAKPTTDSRVGKLGEKKAAFKRRRALLLGGAV